MTEVEEGPRVPATEKVLDLSQDERDLFFGALYGDGEGWVAVSVGKPNDVGRIVPHLCQGFRWPDQSAELFDLADELRSKGLPLFWSPTLKTGDPTGQLLRADATPPIPNLSFLWADVDANDGHKKRKLNVAAVDRLRNLGAAFNASGTPGNAHVFVLLTRPVSIAKQQEMNKALADWLRCDSKWSHASWLRFPGSLNDKPAPEGGVGRIVVPDRGYRRVTRGAVEGLWGSSETATTIDVTVDPGATFEPAEIDLDVIAKLLDKWRRDDGQGDPSDRSDTASHRVRTCKERGLTAGQAWSVMLEFDWWTAKYPTVERQRRDIARCWRLACGAILLPEETFWSAREDLQTIYNYSLAHLVSPYAVLGRLFCYLVCSVPPNVTLPNDSSLNLWVGIVGKSGTGKGRSKRVAHRAINGLADVYEIGPGSGQGVAHLYADNSKEFGMRMIRDTAIYAAEEVDSLMGQAKQVGNTTLAELRKAWCGEGLGVQNATVERTLRVPDQSYRLAVMVGVQPGRAKPLLDETAGGTPQRILWVPAVYPHPPLSKKPEEPAPLEWAGIDPDVREVTIASEVVKETIMTTLWVNSRGEGKEEEAHDSLQMVKLAGAFALLEGRAAITDSDWTLATHLLAKSHETLRLIKDEIGDDIARSAAARGRADGIRAHVAELTKEEQKLASVEARIFERLEAGPLRRAKLKRIFRMDRDLVDPALDNLLARGVVDMREIEYRGQVGHEFTRRG